MTHTLYFAYGSNMSVKRLTARVPSAHVIGTARLDGHQLKFHKASVDGSAKCDIESRQNSEHYVVGVLYKLPLSAIDILDCIEGVGQGYEQKTVTVQTSAGMLMNAISYYATAIDSSLSPYHWYKQHVLTGAREHQLPDDYIRMIDNVVSIQDPVTVRHDNELAIYC